MKFSYTQKRLYRNLFFGIFWLVISLYYFFGENENLKLMSILFSILGIAYLLIFAYEYQQKYFEFTDDKIKLYTIPKKEIKINEITEAKYFAEDYVFKTPNQSLTIVKSQLNKKQLPEFESFFNGLKDTLKK